LACGVSTCCERFREDLVGPLADGLPHVAIYSRRDGIVDWRACRDQRARELEVVAAHCEMPFSTEVHNAVCGAVQWFASTARHARREPGLLEAWSTLREESAAA
jgi:hypothetical protein